MQETIMFQMFSGDFLQWVHTFLSVVDTGSVQRSGMLLHLSPSAVSFQIRKLERELDCTLFERTSQGMEPTQKGLELRQKVLPILESLDELRCLSLSGHRLTGSIYLACLDHVAPELAAHILRFRAAYPGVDFMLEPANPRRLAHLLDSGMVDFGVTIRSSLSGKLSFTELRRSSAFLYTPAGNPYSLPDRPDWARICQLPFIALTLEGHVNPIMTTAPDMSQPGDIVMATNSFPLALTLVRQGVGACIAPPLPPAESPDGFSLFNIDHIFPVGSLGIIRRRSKILSPQAQAFFSQLCKAYARA